jgi:hypothetical protein
LTVPHRDDAPFTDERYRYLRHCAEAGATAASLRLKRNELLRIAAYLGPDASQGIDIEALQRIATERLRLTGLSPQHEEWSTSDDLGFDFSVGGVNQPSCFSTRANSTSM